jgi:uncharacterized protein (TIGR02145 family)
MSAKYWSSSFLIVSVCLALVLAFNCNGRKPTQPEGVVHNVYRTVKIGHQWWMAENLKEIYYRNGDIIPNVRDHQEWSSLTTGACCSYNNDDANIPVYGRLYNWFAIKDSRGLAPSGWHIPSDAEWQILADYLGGDDMAGGKMKEAGTLHWNITDSGATNESGFSALPGGYRLIYGGAFIGLGYDAAFYSSTEFESNYAWFRALLSTDSHIKRLRNLEQSGLSVRCVRD